MQHSVVIGCGDLLSVVNELNRHYARSAGINSHQGSMSAVAFVPVLIFVLIQAGVVDGSRESLSAVRTLDGVPCG